MCARRVLKIENFLLSARNVADFEALADFLHSLARRMDAGGGERSHHAMDVAICRAGLGTGHR